MFRPMSFSPPTLRISARVGLGSPNKVPQTRWLNQQDFGVAQPRRLEASRETPAGSAATAASLPGWSMAIRVLAWSSLRASLCPDLFSSGRQPR